jgi:hypothetical protein
VPPASARRLRPPPPADDPHVASLARLFAEHPAWRAAARHVSRDATSRVLFTHRPGERWHLARRRGRSRLLPGDARDPDLVLRFSPEAIERLARVEGGVGAFAVELFELIAGEHSAARVDLRVAAPFARLARRGYVRLLLAAGWRVVAFGAARGVRTLADLARLVELLRSRPREPWEGDGEGDGDGDGALRPSAR